jgi:hypothetical protein
MDDARKQKQRRAGREMADVMVAAAKKGEPITYGELVDQVDTIKYEPFSQDLDEQLDDISRREDKAGRGMLSAVVVNKKTGMPGDGFFALAEELGREFDNREAFFEQECDRVFDAHRP